MVIVTEKKNKHSLSFKEDAITIADLAYDKDYAIFNKGALVKDKYSSVIVNANTVLFRDAVTKSSSGVDQVVYADKLRKTSIRIHRKMKINPLVMGVSEKLIFQPFFCVRGIKNLGLLDK